MKPQNFFRPAWASALGALFFTLPSPAAAAERWHEQVQTDWDFHELEDDRGAFRILSNQAADGIFVEFEAEMDGCLPALERALEAFNGLQGSDIFFDLDSSGGPPWREHGLVFDSDLWVDPVAVWPGADLGSIMRVVILDADKPNGTGTDFTPMNASGGIWQWDPGAEAWKFPKNVTSYQQNTYLVLGLRRSNFPSASVCSDPEDSPSAEIIAHEIGHALGFSEQRLRSEPDLSMLESPTAPVNVYDVNSASARGGVLRLGAYAQAFLRDAYPFGGFVQAVDDWVVHDEVLFHDPFLDDARVISHSIYQLEEVNPQHLVYDDVSDSYLDCNTREPPIFYAQVSDVSSKASQCSDAELKIAVTSGGSESELHTQLIANPCDSEYNEYGFDAVVSLSPAQVQAAGFTAPLMIGGVIETVDVVVRVGSGFLDRDPSDNEVQMAVVLHPQDTTDPRCARQREGAFAGPTEDARFGHAIATTKRPPYNGQTVVTGAYNDGSVTVEQYARMGGTGGWGPTEIRGAAADRFGKSVAVSDSGTTVVIGAPGAVGDEGRAHVYTRNGSTHDLLRTLNPVDRQTGRFGEAVAITPNAELIFVGHPLWDGMGVVAVFEWSGADYLWKTSIMGSSSDAEFGSALDATNEWLVIGAPHESNSGGAVYTVPLTTGDPNAPAIVGSPSLLWAGFVGNEVGASVSVHDYVMLVGAPGTDGGTGEVLVFAQPFDRGYESQWDLRTTLTADSAPGGRRDGDRYGESVDNYRGNLLVGAPKRDLGPLGGAAKPNAGAAFLYRPRVSGDWEPYEVLSGLGYGDRNNGDRFGKAVALGSMYWVVGAPRVDTEVGGSTYNGVGASRLGPYRTTEWYW